MDIAISRSSFKKTLLEVSDNSWLKVFFLFLLMLLFTPPNLWSGNEETYLGMAWMQFTKPDFWEFSALRDSSLHRLAFEYIFGFFLDHFGFAITHVAGRLIVALLYAVSLSIFFSLLGFSIVESCIIVLAMYGLGQDILGEETLFMNPSGIEGKIPAYGLVFLSFSMTLRQRTKVSYILLGIATYLHFLVGGFWFLATVFYQYFSCKDFKKTLSDSIWYVIVCLPQFFLIIISYLQIIDLSRFRAIIEVNKSASWIYSHFRVPHHVSPFSSAQMLKHWLLNGIIFLFGLTAINTTLLLKVDPGFEKNFAKIITTLHFYLVFSLFISAFDRGGVLGKLYLFRPSSVILLLTLCFFLIVIKARIRRQLSLITMSFLIFLLSVILPTLPISIAAQNINNFEGIDLAWYPSTLDAIVKQSDSRSIFLIDPELDNSYLPFERYYKRPTLVAYKFVPTTKGELIRWYGLTMARQKLFDKGCPAKIMSGYPIKYLIARPDNTAIHSCGSIVLSDNKFAVVKID